MCYLWLHAFIRYHKTRRNALFFAYFFSACYRGRTIWNVLRFALHIFSGKNILNFAFVALCGALQTHFHGRGRSGKRHLQRRFLRKRGAAVSGLALSVSSLRSLPLLPKGEALAWRYSFRFKCQVTGFARGSPFGRAGALAPERARTFAGKIPPQPHFVRQLPQGDAFALCRQLSRHRKKLPLRGSWHRAEMTERVSRPLGEGGCDQREQTEGVLPASRFTLEPETLPPCQRLPPRGSCQSRQALTEGVPTRTLFAN